MTDIESSVFDPIAKELRKKFSGINVAGEYIQTPSKFPHVTIVEQDNYLTEEHLDSSDTEALSTLMYEVSVYSNKASGKKAECRKILNAVDQMLYRMNFRRTAMTPVPNMADATIYRLVARYRVETDGKQFYRR